MHEMYSQPHMLAKFSLLVFLLLLNAFFIDGTMAQATPFSVKVGVVVDMDSDVGKMGLNCIKMALSDFYDRHAYYQTRLVLNSKDSKRDVVGAAAADSRVPFYPAYKSAIPSSATEDRLALELYKLMTMQTRVFIVHLTKELGSRLFTKAKLLGMMTDEYVWITTDGMAYELNSLDPSVIEAMQGVIGVLPHIPKTPESVSFSNRYKKEIQQNNRTVHHVDLNIFGLWAYDSAVALAMAVEKAKVRNDAFLKENISRPSTDLEDFGVSSMGTELIQALSSTTFRGLAGDFYLVDSSHLLTR